MDEGLIQVDEEPPKRGRGRPPTPRLCGTCLFVRYTDSQVLSMRAGTCFRSEVSGRVGVQASEDGCEQWKLRSTDRRRTDLIRQERVSNEVAAVNARVRGRRRV